jgi:hypothetical protein
MNTFFTYTLADIPPHGTIGPDRYLPDDSLTGCVSGGLYYGATSISINDIPAPFSASAVSEGTFWNAYGDEWKAFVANGYTADGLTLAIDDVSLTRWTQTLVLMRESGMNDTASFAIADKDGTIHPKTVAEVRTLLVGAGAYWYQGWIDKTTQTGSI